MPYPAYEGLTFYFSISRGAAWAHHFRAKDMVASGGVAAAWDGWSAVMKITDDTGTVLMTLSTAGGADGTITLGDPVLGMDAIVCFLPAGKTALLPATGTPSGRTDKPFLHAFLHLIDPLYPSDPHLAASGKGVTRTA